MIRLELTLSESEFLHRWLDVPNSLDPECPVRRQLLAKLIAAQQQAMQEQVCPVCNQPFTQFNAGRVAAYCSNACKQKAYRQRGYERKRRAFPPTS